MPRLREAATAARTLSTTEDGSSIDRRSLSFAKRSPTENKAPSPIDEAWFIVDVGLSSESIDLSGESNRMVSYDARFSSVKDSLFCECRRSFTLRKRPLIVTGRPFIVSDEILTTVGHCLAIGGRSVSFNTRTLSPNIASVTVD